MRYQKCSDGYKGIQKIILGNPIDDAYRKRVSHKVSSVYKSNHRRKK